jgi:dihydrofolate reductase
MVQKITMGHTILMGRKTWDSLPGALPGRQNWVLSRQVSPEDGMSVFRSMAEVNQALDPSQDLFVIGGGEIYSMALPLCHELYISEVRQNIPDGDAFFPSYKDDFIPEEVLDDNEDFLLRRWIRSV